MRVGDVAGRLQNGHSGRVALDDDDEGELRSDEYERVSGRSKHDLEQRLLRAARHRFIEQEVLLDFIGDRPTRRGRGALCSTVDRGTVDSVDLEGDGDDVRLIVRFRLEKHPEQRFASAFAVWPAPRELFVEGADSYALLLTIHLMEALDSTPLDSLVEEVDDDGVTWIRPY